MYKVWTRKTYHIGARGSAIMTLLHGQYHIWGMQLPPSTFAEPPGVHLAHVAHANDADYEALHSLRDGGAC